MGIDIGSINKLHKHGLPNTKPRFMILISLSSTIFRVKFNECYDKADENLIFNWRVMLTSVLKVKVNNLF